MQKTCGAIETNPAAKLCATIAADRNAFEKSARLAKFAEKRTAHAGRHVLVL